MNYATKAVTILVGTSVMVIAPLSAASPKGSAHANPVHAAPKLSPTAVLVGNVMLNSVAPGADLYQACKKSSFKTLSWAFYQLRSSLSPEKGEYETSGEYEARVQRLTSAINGSGEIIVCQPLNDNEDAPFAYDADSGVFKGSFRNQFNVWRDIKRTGTYVSKTRMGARATVQASVDVEYNLALANSWRSANTSCLTTNYSGSSYTVPVARDQAPLLKLSGYLVFRGHVVPPFVEGADTAGSPTLDDPHDVYERSITLHFEPTAVTVVGAGGLKPFDCSVRHLDSPTSGQPIAKGGAADWVNSDDYPPSALRSGEEGTTGVRLTVDADGRVTDCSITSSSGFPDLDQTACRLLPRRARFTPVKDAAGNAVASTYATAVPWHIPKD